ncbi:Mannan endo-1,4-beta-mannosidase 2 [Sesamum alatum]|uniref:mannan endo-1,4-beta-mannosidase n=1 Tax=Sesamum alatum TaxID=300844 RepID=A0AAE1XK62_9LAMI|nr:Mannan endo-1,4-beta-mannosidase 2 [Sesamum alatum]
MLTGLWMLLHSLLKGFVRLLLLLVSLFVEPGHLASDGTDQLALQISPGLYHENVFHQALDFVVSDAAKNNVRLINNNQDFGGRPQYVNWAKNAGARISSNDDFYTNAVVKQYYKNHKVLTRINTITGVAYKDDPTVMAWELINEPRCQADYSGNTVDAWVQEMASLK